MREQPDRVWKVVEIKREMLKRGWAPTPKAVEPIKRGSYRKARERKAELSGEISN
jgi:hypothetical protein